MFPTSPPLHIRKTGDQWEGANREGGPWYPIPAPLCAAPADRQTDADRLALAVCPNRCHVSQVCTDCRRDSANHCRELAQILRERHGGSSQVADWLDGVGNG